MIFDDKHYVSQGDLMEYPAILSSIKGSPYAESSLVSKKIIVLGESVNFTQPQKISILFACDDPVANSKETLSEISGIILTFRSISTQLNHSASLATCTKSLMSIYQNQSESDVISSKKQEQDSELIKEFYAMLADAMTRGVSDIHIEARKTTAVVRYRIDGELSVAIASWPTQFAMRFVQAVYSVVAQEQAVTFKPDEPQDAVIDRMINDERLRVRLATIPAAPDGFDCIMRLLPLGKQSDQQKALPLKLLGYSNDHVSLINAGLKKPVGAIIIAGTTGSGKSTTLKNILLEKIQKSDGTIKVITVEDPPEYFIPGATQVPVSRNKKTSDGSSSFQAAVRAAMRSDPDILMVGEVRDAISADLLVSAVQSGHIAFSTVHASSAISIVSRLVGMNVARDVLGSVDFIACLIYQALLPKLCPHCKVPFTKEGCGEDEELYYRVSKTSKPGSTIFLRGPGCDHCNNGIKGKTVVAEVIMPDFVMLRCFYESRSIDALEHWIENGGKQIIHHGIEKMCDGIVSPVDVEDTLGSLIAHIILKDGVISGDEINMMPSVIPQKTAPKIENYQVSTEIDLDDGKWVTSSQEEETSNQQEDDSQSVDDEVKFRSSFSDEDLRDFENDFIEIISLDRDKSATLSSDDFSVTQPTKAPVDYVIDTDDYAIDTIKLKRFGDDEKEDKGGDGKQGSVDEFNEI